MSERTVQAVKDKIVGKIIREANVTKGGIILPDNVEKDPQAYCEVVSVGPDVDTIKIGDVILCHKHGGQDIMLDGVIYKVLIDNEVYGILKEINNG